MTPQFEEIIRRATKNCGLEPDMMLEKINRLVGKHPELKAELEEMLSEAFERAASAELTELG